jgi:hypothetical protein
MVLRLISLHALDKPEMNLSFILSMDVPAAHSA